MRRILQDPLGVTLKRVLGLLADVLAVRRGGRGVDLGLVVAGMRGRRLRLLRRLLRFGRLAAGVGRGHVGGGG